MTFEKWHWDAMRDAMIRHEKMVMVCVERAMKWYNKARDDTFDWDTYTGKALFHLEQADIHRRKAKKIGKMLGM